MLNEFAKNVSDLTDGEVQFEVQPAGAVVGLLLIILFPEIALWLPRVIYGE